ncbi:MAG: hypothetical protein ABR585_01860, partial [Gemmatimonadaceae bacterium]
MIFRRVVPNRAETKKRPSASFLVSVGVHAVVALALMRMLILHGDFERSRNREAVPVERIGFLALPRAGAKAPVPGRAGGDGRPTKSREIHVTPPKSIPTLLPAPTTAPIKPGVEEGTGPVVGTGGPARGIRPAYTDPRVWAPPGKIVTAPKTVAETIDSMIAEAIAPYNDSAAAAAQRRDPTDWTTEKGGHKWGIDRHAIRLGPVSIPTALLALLPLNIQGNPQTMERDRAYNAMHRDIAWHAQQGVNEADFMKAVRSIRERKERERAAALAAPASASKDPSSEKPRE